MTKQTNSPTGCACASDPTLKTCACCVAGATVCTDGPRKNVQCVKTSVAVGALRTAACLKVSALDYEQKASYTLQLTATDKPTPAGIKSSQKKLTLDNTISRKPNPSNPSFWPRTLPPPPGKKAS